MKLTKSSLTKISQLSLIVDETFATLGAKDTVTPPYEEFYFFDFRVKVKVDEKFLQDKNEFSSFSHRIEAKLYSQSPKTTQQKYKKSKLVQKYFANSILEEKYTTPDPEVFFKGTAYFVDAMQLHKKHGGVYRTIDLVDSGMSFADVKTKNITNSGVNNDLINFVNSNKFDPSEVALFPFNSKDDLSGNRPLVIPPRYDKSAIIPLLKKFLHEIPGSPADDDLLSLNTETVTKEYDYIEVNVRVFFDILKIKDLNAKVDILLLNETDDSPIQRITKYVNIEEHLNAMQRAKFPPVAKVNPVHYFATKIVKNYELRLDDPNSKFPPKSYNVYRKSLSSLGLASKVTRIATGIKDKFTLPSNAELEVLKIVPVDIYDKEINQFTNCVVGKGYKSIGSPCLDVAYDKQGLRFRIHNVPPAAKEVCLYRRIIGSGRRGSFALLARKSIAKELQNFTFNHSENVNSYVGKFCEFYARILLANETPYQKQQSDGDFLSTNVVPIRVPNTMLDSTINVVIKNQNVDVTSDEIKTFSFDITTKVDQKEQKKLNDLIRSQAPDLYDMFINPQNNTSNPLKIDDYASIFVHEIIRTNLATGEREAFNMVGDGTFTDDTETQKSSAVQALNPQHDYLYQIFTYRRNPMTVFKNYVVKGNKDGKDYFYLPYKWKNPTVVSTGVLYGDDPETGVPIIDSYEELAAEGYGLTGSKFCRASDESVDFSIFAKRIDLDTIKISWNLPTNFNTSFFDHFIVMKVVNGVRSFVGRTALDFIYHDISLKDLGNVYFMVVPITSDFNIEPPRFSNVLLIEPDGLVAKTPVIN